MMTDNNEEFLDKDGYPTDEALDKKSFFEFIKSLWCWEEYFDEEEDEDEIFKHPIIRYHISTGGWSGNESLIGALSKNAMIWTTTWVQSRRGGHYIFELKLRKK